MTTPPGSQSRLRLWILAVACVGLASCTGDETVRAYGAADRSWTLVELNGQPFRQSATLSFPEPGRIAGNMPCNSYSADMAAPYPWFEARQIVSTRTACPALAEETAFLAALATMTQSEVSGQVLILRDDTGREMVFRAAD